MGNGVGWRGPGGRDNRSTTLEKGGGGRGEGGDKSMPLETEVEGERK